MDEWPIDLSTISSHSAEQIRPGPKPLQDGSGNRQACVLDCHAGAENQKPQDSAYPPLSFSEDKCPPSRPLDEVTLGPEDGQITTNRILQRQRRRHRHQYKDRSYLHCKNYLAYRARQRKDLGTDNRQVWSDHVEEAFQEALWLIESLGLEKRSQNGKPYGKNQLIAKYIEQKTGEVRDRKQVMSHLQVLDPLLRDQPSWRALTKRGKKGGYAQNANRGCYEISTANKMQHQRWPSSEHAPYLEDGGQVHSDHLPPPSQTLGSNGFVMSQRWVAGVNFEMWMSPNRDHMEERLHDFTSLQSDREVPRCDPTPLESIRNWRSLYPCLAEIIDGKTEPAKMDIIMVDTSYKVMHDFPPPKASLGLRLELSLGPSAGGEAIDWTCTSRIFRNGVLVKEPSHYRLESTWGTIAPPFETKWWAKTFIEQVEQRKQIEEKGQGAVYEAMQERAHGFFSELTAVHEIWASCRGDDKRRLIAVLLWKFSMAPERYVGTTSWQRLVPPPRRSATNSPSPSPRNRAIPPFAIDSVVASLPYPPGSSPQGDFFIDRPAGQYNDGAEGLDSANILASQLDFGISFDGNGIDDFEALQSSLMAPTHNGHNGSSYHALDHIDCDLHLQDLPNSSHQDMFQLGPDNPFGPHHPDAIVPRPPTGPGEVYDIIGNSEREVDDSTTRRPLANFDHSTHDSLQAQLRASRCDSHGPPRTAAKDPSHANETLEAALAAASAMNDLSHSPIGILSDHYHPLSRPTEGQDAHHMCPPLWESMPSAEEQQQRPSLYDSEERYSGHASTSSYRAATHNDERAVHPSGLGHQDGTVSTSTTNVPDSDAHTFDVNQPMTTETAATPSSSQMQRLLEMHGQ